jgi:hypothetical protein
MGCTFEGGKLEASEDSAVDSEPSEASAVESSRKTGEAGAVEASESLAELGSRRTIDS